MHKWPKLFESMTAIVLGLAAVVPANAADPARGASTARGRTASNAGQRMPTLPALPIFPGGNMSTSTPSNPDASNPGVTDPEPQPIPSNCADGGVETSDYTVDNCMNDILTCVNNGALPGGLNDLFNEDLRNSIMNGMGLCLSQVERCMADVRKNCAPVYNAASDVWIDFNSRKIQPEYYNFVLRKTGLTPNQAENTCYLLDKNTFGPSFAAVDNGGRVTAEYNNQVGAYNGQQGNVLIKNNPQGLTPNTGNDGVDGARGHYARWDATTATCLLRVAAYNKDKHITNTWLFGAAGDDKPAEVWRAAGESFSCNKDLFGFSLMNKTSTAAVVGMGGGAVLGGAIGAAAGGKHKMDCDSASWRKELGETLRASNKIGVLNEYLINAIPVSGDVSQAQCEEIVRLYDTYNALSSAVAECKAANKANLKEGEKLTIKTDLDIELVQPVKGDNETEEAFAQRQREFNEQVIRLAGAMKSAADPTGCEQQFKSINLAFKNGTGIYCSGSGSDCATTTEISTELARLNTVWASIKIDGIETGRSRGASAAIGAGVGAGAGGVAAAITAFIEKNNISCRVGDGLDQVGYGKSYNIGTLRDFYVKWNLQLPDTVAPTAQVTDCASWQNACAKYTDLNQCAVAQVNYKPAGAVAVTLVPTACQVSGSACVANTTVARSQGACQ